MKMVSFRVQDVDTPFSMTPMAFLPLLQDIIAKK